MIIIYCTRKWQKKTSLHKTNTHSQQLCIPDSRITPSTFSTMFDLNTLPAFVTFAPAASYSLLLKLASTPAPSSTLTVKPFLTNVSTVAGTMATRRSFGKVSFGTPIDNCLYGIPRTDGASATASCTTNILVKFTTVTAHKWYFLHLHTMAGMVSGTGISDIWWVYNPSIIQATKAHSAWPSLCG